MLGKKAQNHTILVCQSNVLTINSNSQKEHLSLFGFVKSFVIKLLNKKIMKDNGGDEADFDINKKKNTLRVWCRLRDLNPRPSDYKSDALPTGLNRQVWQY